MRDFLLGREPGDYDIATSALPEQIEKLFKRTVAVGRKFGVMIVVEDAQQFQVATFRAEADYRNAAQTLEGEYARLRPSLDPELARRWDETLTRARAQLGESRAVAADDVNVRMRVLDGYAGYLRSLRDVLESEEANP